MTGVGASTLEGEADVMNKKGDCQTVKNRVKKKKSGQTRRDKTGVAWLVLSGQGLFSHKMPVEQRPEWSHLSPRGRKETPQQREQQVGGCRYPLHVLVVGVQTTLGILARGNQQMTKIV